MARREFSIRFCILNFAFRILPFAYFDECSILQSVLSKFPGTTTSEFRGQSRVGRAHERHLGFLAHIKEEHEFDYLADINMR